MRYSNATIESPVALLFVDGSVSLIESSMDPRLLQELILTRQNVQRSFNAPFQRSFSTLLFNAPFQRSRNAGVE